MEIWVHLLVRVGSSTRRDCALKSVFPFSQTEVEMLLLGGVKTYEKSYMSFSLCLCVPPDGCCTTKTSPKIHISINDMFNSVPHSSPMTVISVLHVSLITFPLIRRVSFLLRLKCCIRRVILQYWSFSLLWFCTHCPILFYSQYEKKIRFCLFPFDLCFTSGVHYDRHNEKIILGILLLLQEWHSFTLHGGTGN